MAELTYSVRPHSFSGTQTYELQGDALSVHAGEAVKRIPYGEIESLRLIEFVNFSGVQRQCTIKTRGHGTLKLPSHHFVSLGQFEPRTASYIPFVQELGRRVHAANPNAQFIQGSGAMRVVWAIILLLAVIGWVAWIAAHLGSAVGTGRTVIGFFVLLIVSLVGLTSFRRTRVRSFDPSDPNPS